MPQAYHHSSRDHVQYEFGRSARLEARAAGDKLRSHDRHNGDVDLFGYGRIFVAGDARGQRARLPRRTQSPQHIGRPARSGNADHGVIGSGFESEQIAGSLARAVFGPLDGIAYGAVATRDYADEFARHAVGRRYLGGVGDADTPAGACTHVEDPTATAHPLGNPFDHRGNLWDSPPHRLGHETVFVVHGLQQLLHGHFVQGTIV